MMSQLVQFLLAGMTVGSTYALAALGYTFVYSASGMINFAQGEFIMLGAMSASALVAAGVPLLPALVVAIAFTTLVGIALAKLAIEPARNASITSLIIITLGSGQVIRGAVQLVLGKGNHAFRACRATSRSPSSAPPLRRRRCGSWPSLWSSCSG
jgi:branched-chain amino acid transport system permease protein